MEDIQRFLPSATLVMGHPAPNSKLLPDQEAQIWDHLIVNTASDQDTQMDSSGSKVQLITPSRTRFSTPGPEDDWASYSQASNYTTPGSTVGEVLFLFSAGSGFY